MRAAIMRQHQIVEDTFPDPEPGPGEVLVKTLACGICGSDLHALQHLGTLAEVAREAGAPFEMSPDTDVVMGHEFCAEIVDYGPDTSRRLSEGTRVVSMPVLFRNNAPLAVGYSTSIPGGYGEAMVLSEALVLEVPNGLSTDHAALTEPMAVGEHAAAKANLGPRDCALVFGCGPVGLAVIAALRRRNVENIVAADFSPMRRKLAEQMGATRAVDPSAQPAIDVYNEIAAFRPTVLFECVGVPGMLEQLVRDAPVGARIVVAGVCMEPDQFRPMLAINKELNIQFVLAYTPVEFTETLRAIAEGELNVSPLVTGRVGLAGVARAFEDLGRPDEHAKIMVDPTLG